MRSNDIIWGLPYDIFMFTNLQQVIANTLNLKLGWYEHNPTSMHVYSNHYNMLKEMSNTCEPIETNNDLDYSSLSIKHVNICCQLYLMIWIMIQVKMN